MPWSLSLQSIGGRLRDRGPATVGRGLRLTTAAVASYGVATQLVADARPVTAALTALLIVQVTLVGTLADTARRIVSVVVGVGIAITVSSFVGFTWWSLAGIVAGSLLVGQALRLGPHLLEVPISAMLILAVGGAAGQAADRVGETLIGAAVGVLLNILVPPSVQSRTAGAAIERFAADMAGVLSDVAQTLRERVASQDEVHDWLARIRSIDADVARIDQVLQHARQSRRLNPRAAGTVDTTPDLRSGLDALEHTAVALRTVFRALADGLGTAAADERPTSAQLVEEAARGAFATLLSDLARCICAFGALLRAEVDDTEEPHTAELAEALDALGEARARLTEMLLVDARETPTLWQLHGSLLGGIDRILRELDVEERGRRRARRREEAAATRRPAAQAAERLRATTRRELRERAAARRGRGER